MVKYFESVYFALKNFIKKIISHLNYSTSKRQSGLYDTLYTSALSRRAILLYDLLLPSSYGLAWTDKTRECTFMDSMRGGEPNLTKSVGVRSKMQSDIIVRQTNVDVRATSAVRAVYFWQWAGNLASTLQIREQVGV